MCSLRSSVSAAFRFVVLAAAFAEAFLPGDSASSAILSGQFVVKPSTVPLATSSPDETVERPSLGGDFDHLNAKTLVELRQIARDLRIRGRSQLRKAELIQRIREYYEETIARKELSQPSKADLIGAVLAKRNDASQPTSDAAKGNSQDNAAGRPTADAAKKVTDMVGVGEDAVRYLVERDDEDDYIEKDGKRVRMKLIGVNHIRSLWRKDLLTFNELELRSLVTRAWSLLEIQQAEESTDVDIERSVAPMGKEELVDYVTHLADFFRSNGSDTLPLPPSVQYKGALWYIGGARNNLKWANDAIQNTRSYPDVSRVNDWYLKYALKDLEQVEDGGSYLSNEIEESIKAIRSAMSFLQSNDRTAAQEALRPVITALETAREKLEESETHSS